MEVVYKEKFNTIFWKFDSGMEWHRASIYDILEAYEESQYTKLDYKWPVKDADTGEIKSYVFACRNCDGIVCSEDADPGYRYCPHCGKIIED